MLKTNWILELKKKNFRFDLSHQKTGILSNFTCKVMKFQQKVYLEKILPFFLTNIR